MSIFLKPGKLTPLCLLPFTVIVAFLLFEILVTVIPVCKLADIDKIGVIQYTGASQWASLGGVLNSSVSPIIQEDGNISIFASTSDGLWHINSSKSGWGNWTLVSAADLKSAPAAVRINKSTLAVFSRGPENALWYAVLSEGTPISWTLLGGTFQSDPAAILVNGTSILVMVEALDGALWYKTYDKSGRWDDWRDFGSHASSSPSLVKIKGGGIQMYVRGLDDKLWFKESRNNGWTEWKTLSGNISNGPSGLQLKNGTVAVFAIGYDKSLWYRTSYKGVWDNWTGLGGSLFSTPSAVQLKNGTVAVFGLGSDKSLWYKYLR